MSLAQLSTCRFWTRGRLDAAMYKPVVSTAAPQLGNQRSFAPSLPDFGEVRDLLFALAGSRSIVCLGKILAPDNSQSNGSPLCRAIASRVKSRSRTISCN